VRTQKIKDSRWNNSFKNLSFRVDVEAMTKSGRETGEPLALVEFTTTSNVNRGASNSGANATAKFEMNRTQMNEMLETLREIQKKFDESSF